MRGVWESRKSRESRESQPRLSIRLKLKLLLK